MTTEYQEQMPLITVVMGVYNHADTLKAALDGIFTSSDVPMECIAVNDGSTDGTETILDVYAAGESRLRVVHQENTGLTRALIHGCALARSPWIARQDADDISLPGRFAELLALTYQYPKAVMVASAVWVLGPDKEKLYTIERTTDPLRAREEVGRLGIGPPAHGAVMFSKAAYERVGGYRAAFYFAQDSDLWMRLAAVGGVVYSTKPLYCASIAPGSISGYRRKRQHEFGYLARQCRDARLSGKGEAPYLARAETLSAQLRAEGIPSACLRDQWLTWYHIGCLLEASDPEKALSYFRTAAQCHPWAWRPRVKQWWLRRHRARRSCAS